MDRDPYVQIFFRLRGTKDLCLKYRIVVCPKTEPTRQVVLGTGNQEKEPPHRHPVKAHLPQLLSCLVLLPCIQASPHTQEHPLHNSQLEYVP